MCVKHRTGVASVDYGELMKQSFSLGPSRVQQFANASRYTAVAVALGLSDELTAITHLLHSH